MRPFSWAARVLALEPMKMSTGVQSASSFKSSVAQCPNGKMDSKLRSEAICHCMLMQGQLGRYILVHTYTRPHNNRRLELERENGRRWRLRILRKTLKYCLLGACALAASGPAPGAPACALAAEQSWALRRGQTLNHRTVRSTSSSSS